MPNPVRCLAPVLLSLVLTPAQAEPTVSIRGLAIALRTDTPRRDASVSVWLREEDGSWYYLRSAVPLVDATNTARTAWKISLRLDGAIVATDEVARKQFFSPDLLDRVHLAEPFATQVRLDEAALREARRAWLRVVVEDLQEGAGYAMVGDPRVGLPRAYTADNVCRTMNLSVDPRRLTPETPVMFHVNVGNFGSYHMPMTSLVLETRSE